jgi:hypothetical protein
MPSSIARVNTPMSFGTATEGVPGALAYTTNTPSDASDDSREIEGGAIPASTLSQLESKGLASAVRFGLPRFTE